nr:MAG TPA: FAM165 family [Caudoviricetes sp.]
MPMSTAPLTLETVPALVFIAAVLALILAVGMFALNIWQRRELEHLHAELYTLRMFRDTVEFIDEPREPEPAPVRKPRPIPEGLEVIHPAVNR